MDKYQLSSLQLDFLQAFFQREHRFFLTGGAALVGFHLGHRETHDLDLFTMDDVMAEGFAVVTEVARQLTASIESLQTAPDFRRLLIRRNTEAIVIDLVRECKLPDSINSAINKNSFPELTHENIPSLSQRRIHHD